MYGGELQMIYSIDGCARAHDVTGAKRKRTPFVYNTPLDPILVTRSQNKSTCLFIKMISVQKRYIMLSENVKMYASHRMSTIP